MEWWVTATPAMVVVLKADSLLRGFSSRSSRVGRPPGVVTSKIGEFPFIYLGGVLSSFKSDCKLDTIEPLLEFKTNGVDGSADLSSV